ncbi:MAG: hypothetical protein JW829_06455 [Pirellulales bacterium]|nr:hypothetical protein [Pirellulales bacterium]
MFQLKSFLVVFAIALTLVLADDCLAGHPMGGHFPAQRAARYNWHGWYVHTAYGQPVALVVPPTAQLQTNWSWGVGSSRISRIDHQFGRSWPGPFQGGMGFGHTPAWPSDTHQFGVYYVRAPR